MFELCWRLSMTIAPGKGSAQATLTSLAACVPMNDTPSSDPLIHAISALLRTKHRLSVTNWTRSHAVQRMAQILGASIIDDTSDNGKAQVALERSFLPTKKARRKLRAVADAILVLIGGMLGCSGGIHAALMIPGSLDLASAVGMYVDKMPGGNQCLSHESHLSFKSLASPASISFISIPSPINCKPVLSQPRKPRSLLAFFESIDHGKRNTTSHGDYRGIIEDL